MRAVDGADGYICTLCGNWVGYEIVPVPERAEDPRAVAIRRTIQAKTVRHYAEAKGRRPQGWKRPGFREAK